VFRLPQTTSDCLGALMQVEGSPFDCAGLGSTDGMRMACKRPGVRVPLAPPQVKLYNSNAKPVTMTLIEGHSEGHVISSH
jgi:hypothetical protein